MMPPGLLACAPNVAPVTLEAVIAVESGGNPLAVHVNGLREQPLPAHDAGEAVQIAAHFITLGYSVDLGLMQVNSRNLTLLGLTIEQIFDPCTNIRSGSTILSADYAAAAHFMGPGQPALQAALSAYNSGDFYRGIANGYLAHYYGRGSLPSLAVGPPQSAMAVPSKPPRVAAAADPYTVETRVFARETSRVRIE